jgi:hypothetical protein
MNPLPTFRAVYGYDIGIELFFAFPNINANEKSFFNADSATGATSLSANGINFAANQYILLGQAGNEFSEIAQIATANSTTVTLVSPANFPHNRGDLIRFIPYNQITAEWSINNGVSFSAMSAINIRADSTETYLQRPADLSSYVYRFRFSNSTTSQFSAYSDTVSGAGYADNTIYAVKKRALDQLGEVRSDLITDQFLNDCIQEARRYADMNPATFRWSFRTKFGVVQQQMLAGQWQIKAPADLRDRNTYKNILSIRIGNQNRPILYQNRVRFNQNYLNVRHATLSAPVSFGAGSITLSSTHDLDNAGVLSVAGGTIGQLITTINYTGNNKTTNTLTGVTGVPAAGYVSGLDVWQQAVYGLPTAYTIDNGVISFDLPLMNIYDGMDAKMDYYGIIPPISTDDQTFDEDFYDLYVPYLKFRIKYAKSNGKIDRDGDTDWKDWLTGLDNLVSQQVTGQIINYIPDVDGFMSATE